ncbi:Ig-like domain-containing protein [Curtobacterium sp. MCPF17_002]|uniref:Ig-like domain-containing protein n=1 Tax=Curtobacterium sp. MCPF17_002 TaxID=2175645 RepID=UPI000DAA077B|nr:Ig-like domain-containing protein [Curtobacterium sp. MCPF17_002]WIB78043.1 Ig-like domain-containing protein [Curtobacterium sp. MCPF17_002]
MRKRNTLKVLGAAVLAAATVASVLGVGSTAASAAPSGTATSESAILSTAWPPQNTKVVATPSSLTLTATPYCSGACTLYLWAFSDSEHQQMKYGSNPWPSWWTPGTMHKVEFVSVGTQGSASSVYATAIRPYATSPVTAQVDSVDDAERTANLSGTATPGAEIKVGNVRIAWADTNGRWSGSVSGLSVGTQTVTVDQFRTGSKVNSTTVSITVEDPGTPTEPITARVDSVDDAERTAKVSGTATKDAEIRVGDRTIARADSDGNWTGTLTGLRVGAQDVVISQYIGGVQVNDTTVTVTVKDTEVAPLVVTTPANGSTVDTNRPVFSGTGDKGATIEIGGVSRVVAITTVDADGKWSVPAGFDLPDGIYNLTAKQTPLSGAASSQPVSFTVKNAADTVPLTATGAFDADVAKPATISGKATPGAVVIVRDVVGNEIARTVATTNATYTVGIPANTAQFGVNDFAVTQTVKGDVSAPVRVSLDYGNPVAPVITSPIDGATVTAGKVTFTGTGDSGSKLEIRGLVSAVGTSTVVNGAWSVETRELTANVYKLFAVQTSKGGLTKQVETTITLEDKKVTELTASGTFAPAPDAPATISGNAETGAPVVIKEGATVIATVIAADGKYSATIPATVSGVRTFSVTQTVGGVVSPAKTATLDYGTVAGVQVTSPANGDVVKAGTVTFTGTGTPGAIVKVSGISTQLGAATVNAQGNWSVTLIRELTPQDYTLFTKQTTKGNLVGDTVNRTFTVIN